MGKREGCRMQRSRRERSAETLGGGLNRELKIRGDEHARRGLRLSKAAQLPDFR
jgi:hypothetical protein